MGTPKQLLQFCGSSLLRRSVSAAIAAGCVPVIVVTGANAEASCRELDGLDVRTVFNPGWQTGMASSIAAGIKVLAGSGIDAAVLMVCDQPHVTRDVISSLVDAHRVTGKRIVASAYGGSFGVPALFSCVLFPELSQLEGAGGAKAAIAQHTSEVHFVPFAAGEVDLDTPEDFSRAVASLSAEFRLEGVF